MQLRYWFLMFLMSQIIVMSDTNRKVKIHLTHGVNSFNCQKEIELMYKTAACKIKIRDGFVDLLGANGCAAAFVCNETIFAVDCCKDMNEMQKQTSTTEVIAEEYRLSSISKNDNEAKYYHSAASHESSISDEMNQIKEIIESHFKRITALLIGIAIFTILCIAICKVCCIKRIQKKTAILNQYMVNLTNSIKKNNIHHHRTVCTRCSEAIPMEQFPSIISTPQTSGTNQGAIQSLQSQDNMNETFLTEDSDTPCKSRDKESNI